MSRTILAGLAAGVLACVATMLGSRLHAAGIDAVRPAWFDDSRGNTLHLNKL